MFKINGKLFYDIPRMCGTCRFFLSFGKGDMGKDRAAGICTLFNKRKSKYNNLPKRCQGMFDKAKTFPDGEELVLVIK